MIQKQTWKDEIRILITATTTPCCGSIYILATFKKKLLV